MKNRWFSLICPVPIRSERTEAIAPHPSCSRSHSGVTSAGRMTGLLRGRERALRVVVGLAALGLLDQRRGRLEALAVALGQLAGARDEPGQPALVAVDVLEHAAGPAREPDAHDRADVGVGDRLDDALVEALDRLDGLDEEHALFEVDERPVEVVAPERVLQARPQPGALAVLAVLVEAGAGQAPAAVELVEHAVDDLRRRVLLERDALGL